MKPKRKEVKGVERSDNQAFEQQCYYRGYNKACDDWEEWLKGKLDGDKITSIIALNDAYWKTACLKNKNISHSSYIAKAIRDYLEEE